MEFCIDINTTSNMQNKMYDTPLTASFEPHEAFPLVIPTTADVVHRFQTISLQ